MEFLETKDALPVTRGPIVESPRRQKALGVSLERPLTVVFAPPGYGKTTLCSSFCKNLPAGKYKVVWLSLDESDSLGQTFVFDLVNAIHRALPDLGLWDLLSNRFDDLDDPEKSFDFLVSLANALSRSKKHLYILLDNYDLLPSSSAAHIRYLAQSVASNVSLVLITSTPVGMDFGDLVLSGDLVQITTADLLMSREECEFFLEENCGIKFTEEQLDEICSLSCGCVFSLKVIATCFAETGDNNGNYASTLERCKSRLQSFALSRLLRMFDEQTVRFLVKMSFAPRFTVGLCNAVGIEELQRDAIVKLKASGVLDEQRIGFGSWYSIAEPYEDALISLRDQYLSNEERASVCDALVKWYEDEEMIEEALELLITQKNESRFISLFTRNMETLLQRNDGSRILEWLGGMSETAATSNLVTMLASAWGCFTAGQPEESLVWLRYVFAGYNYEHIRTREENPDYYDLWSLIKTIEACATSQTGDYKQGIKLSEAGIERLGDVSEVLADRTNLWLWVTLWHNLGESYMMTGDLKKAIEALSTSRVDSIVARRPILYHFNSYEIGLIRLFGGNLQAAGRLFRETLRIGKTGIPVPQTWAQGLVHLGLSQLMLYEGRMQDAYKAFESARTLVSESTNIDGYLECMIQRCALELASGNVARAHSAICEAYNDAMSVCVARGVAQDVLIERAKVEVLLGNMMAAQQVLSECEDMIAPEDAVRVSRFKGICAYYHAVRKQPETALGLVEEAIELANGLDLGLLSAEFSMLRAGILLDLGLKGEAAKEAENTLRSLSGMGAVGVWRSFESYPPVRNVLEKLVHSSDPAFSSHRRDRGFASFAQSCLDFLGGTLVSENDAISGADALTAKEQLVCDMLADGKTRKEIADELGVSTNTVKTHVRSVYRKLGVHSNKELKAARGMEGSDLI